MNRTKTFMLMAAMAALFMGLGFLIGGRSGMLIAFVIVTVAPITLMVLTARRRHRLERTSTFCSSTWCSCCTSRPGTR